MQYKSSLNRPISSKKVNGDYGIELEVEGKFPPLSEGQEILKTWTTHSEGSLRDGAEFVSSQPMPDSKLDDHLKEMDAFFKKCKLNLSIRCSTHIHLNVTTLTMLQVFNVLIFYYLIEDLLVRTQGRMRIGNLFCLRFSDAEGIYSNLSDVLGSYPHPTFAHVNENSLKYSALNLATIRKFGSLEFRFFRPMSDMKLLAQWCRLLRQMIKQASDIDVHAHLHNVIVMDSVDFLKTVFHKSDIELILSGSNTRDLKDSMLQNWDFLNKLAAQMLETGKSEYISERDLDLEESVRPVLAKRPAKLAHILDVLEDEPQ